jgi:opacity protein-like surface antigen
MRIVGVFVALLMMAVSPVLAQDEAPMARENRGMVVLNFAFGLVDMAGFNEYAGTINDAIEAQGVNISDYSDPLTVIGADLGFRYYAPYHIFAHIGVGAVLHKQDYKLSKGNAGSKNKFWNMTMELPILVGGHYAVHDRVHLHGAIGPTILLIPGSYWDNADVGMPDFEGDSSVGMQLRIGADVYAAENIAFGFELVYRHEKVDVTEKDGKKVLVGGKAVDGYEMDFSGIGLTVGVHFAF